jgi:hypothetical protein
MRRCLTLPNRVKETEREGKEVAIIVAIAEEEGRGLFKISFYEAMSLPSTTRDKKDLERGRGGSHCCCFSCGGGACMVFLKVLSNGNRVGPKLVSIDPF